MSDSAVSKVAKPQLRGLLHRQIKLNLGVAIAVSIGATLAFKVLVNDQRKERYANFYKTYDIEKEFNIMRNKGLFDSCEPDN